jgi:hypothetical protein
MSLAQEHREESCSLAGLVLEGQGIPKGDVPAEKAERLA